jgi:hypothetical protein
MNILFQHTWIFFIGITVLNAIILKYRSKKYIEQNPELEDGYNSYIKGFLIFSNIPWLVMMIGDLGGFTKSAFDFLTPHTMNPIVLVFHLSIFVLWILLAWWVYFRNGAEFLATHPGLLNNNSLSSNGSYSVNQIKWIVPFILLGGVTGFIMMWFTNG